MYNSRNQPKDFEMKKFETITDSVTTCDCCGKTNLKNTVVLLDDETSDFVYYGSVCAQKALGYSKPSSKVSFLASQKLTEMIKKAVELGVEIKWHGNETAHVDSTKKEAINNLFDWCNYEYGWMQDKKKNIISICS